MEHQTEEISDLHYPFAPNVSRKSAYMCTAEEKTLDQYIMERYSIFVMEPEHVSHEIYWSVSSIVL